MPSLYFAAKSGSLEEFESGYEPAQAATWTSETGQTLLHLALSNPDPAARVAIADRLLDDGADPAAVFGPEGYTTLHILLGRGEHDAAAEAPLLERLLDGGADVNAVATGWGTPLQTLASELKFSDDQLAPFYDVLLARPDLDLLRPGKADRSSLESARRLAKKRAGLVARMEDYLHRHGQQAEES